MRGLTFCSALLGGALIASLSLGETTEVTVEKGAVQAQTERGTATIVPGQKGILKQGQAPEVTVDDVLVADVMRMKKWVDEEKQQAQVSAREQVTIQSYEFDTARLKAAAYCSVPEDLIINGRQYSKETGTYMIGRSGPNTAVTAYDMSGKKISSEVGSAGQIYLRLGPLDPARDLQLVTVVESPAPDFCSQKDGALRRCIAGNGSPDSLNYYRVILPKAAILVAAWPTPICINDSDGRTTVTLRQRNFGNGANFVVAYLWPEKDGVTMDSLPSELRGLRNARDLQLSEFYQRTMADILAGTEFRDQSTPVAALLTWRCAIVRNDQGLWREACYGAHKKGDQLVVHEVTKPYFIEEMTLLSTPAWPEQPKEGYIHPVYMCYPGTLLRCDTHAVIFNDGKWRVIGNTGNWSETEVSVFEKFK
jgi:hypothetical protein